MTAPADVVAALRRVFDPCSVACDVPLDIVDLGLVVDYELSVAGDVRVTLCLTGPGCMLAPRILDAAHRELARLPEVSSVHVAVDPGVIWGPHRMSRHATRRLDRARRRGAAVAPVRPWARRNDAEGAIA